MQDLQSARVRRTDKAGATSGRKSKSKVTKTGQQRRESTPYNDSSFNAKTFNKSVKKSTKKTKSVNQEFRSSRSPIIQ
jgi:hypothetical protein